jgi:hypothetical protein
MKLKELGGLNSNASDVCSGGDRFESLPRHQQNK